MINTKNLKFLFSLLFSLLANFFVAQNPYAINIDKSSGLPSNSVFDVFQDSNGYMWFGTGKGLCRYDGNNFKTFSANFQTSKSGTNINEDMYGRIWYTNFDGFLYYVKDQKLQALPQEKALGFYKYGIIKNELFIVQPNAVFVYDLKTLKVKKKIIIPTHTIIASYATKDNFYMIGDRMYDFSSSEKYKDYPLPKDFEEKNFVPIISEWQNKLYLNTKYSKQTYTYQNGIFKEILFNRSPQFIQNSSIVDDELWMASSNGIFRFDKNLNQIQNYFAEDNISSIYQDNKNHYWISTLNRGLLFIQDFSTKFISLPQKPTVLSLGKRNIFVGTDKDLVYQLDSETLQYKSVFKSNINHPINQIYADVSNEQLFFTSKQFNIMNRKNEIVKDFALAVKDVKKVDDKYFSFAATGLAGIFCVNPQLKSDWDLIFNKNKKEKFSGFNQSFLINHINSKSTTYFPANKKIYYATNNGLLAVNHFGESKEIKYKNQTIYLKSLITYRDEIIALSTTEKLYKIDKNDHISLFNLPQVLQNQEINYFKIFNDFAYLFTATAVYEYNLETKIFRKVLSLNNEIEATDVLLKNNQLFFATSKGIVIKNLFESNKFPKPKLILNDLFANGVLKSGKNLENLNRKENDIDIQFSILSFIPNEKYKLVYKINNGSWKILGENDTNLKLLALSPGKYDISLAINSNNELISTQNISFEIRKAIWQKTYFIATVMLLFLFLVWSLYRFEIAKVKKKNLLILEKVNLEKNLNESKLTAIKSQMNPHFFYNALNTIQSFILSNDKKEALSYLSKFSALTRKILEMTEKENISIADEVKTLQLYLDIEKARFEEHFSYKINVDDKIDAENTKIPTMLLQTYLENALKHGLLHKKGDKLLELNFIKNENNILIEIIDNGIGREKSAALNSIKNKNHTSFATNAMQTRIELLNKNKVDKITISITDKTSENEQTVGTKVSISIPI